MIKQENTGINRKKQVNQCFPLKATAVAIVFILLLATLAACAPAAQTTPASTTQPTTAAVKPLDITVTNINTRNDSRSQKVIDPWLDSVEKASAGKIKFTRYYLADVAKPPEYYDAVLNARVDMALCAPLISPGRFPMLEVVDIPRPAVTNRPARLVWDIYKKYPQMQSEFKDVKLIYLYATPAKYFMFNKPVSSMEDLKGLKVATTGKYGPKVAAALGFTSVSINRDEVMMSAQTGVLSGSTAGWSSMPPGDKGGLSWGEAFPYVVEVGMGSAPYAMIMNLQKWNSLPDDIKKVFENLGGDNSVDNMDKTEWQLSEDSKKATLAAYPKAKAISLSAQELERWTKALMPVEAEYAAEVDAKKLPGTQLVKDFDELLLKLGIK